MQSLKTLTDETLLKETEKLVRQERELLTEILHHLREIERRRLFCEHSSLFSYAVGVLGYSEDQACRRIAAMRLVRELPEIEESIASGELTLSHIGVAQTLFSNEKKQGRPLTSEMKTEVLGAIAGKSVREAQKAVLAFAPEPPVRKDEIKPLAPGRNLGRFELADETIAKIESLKGLLAHEKPNMPFDDLVSRLCDLGLKEWSPAREPKRKVEGNTKAAVRRAVWKRDGCRCTVCGSTYKVEEDHRVPRSLGGEYTLENIRLLCQSCNQRAAIEKLGQEKMDPYLSPATFRVGTQVRAPVRPYEEKVVCLHPRRTGRMPKYG